MAEDILVSISLLVSNRKDTIRKCMDSLKPLLDAVPSELIAVDTIGEENSDGSIAIIREYTDKIIYFPWCNDFAAARNAGLKEAKGKWFLTIDDDEWFEDITPIIKFFQEGEYKNYDRAWYYVRNYHNFAGTDWVDTFADRMCVIKKETKYEGRVHECLLPYPEKVMQFFCYTHHYGYVFENEDARKKHSERNISLLEQEVKEHPEDARMIGQLVQEYAMAKRYEDAEQLCENWLGTYKEQIRNPFAQFTAVMWLRVLSAQGKKEEAEKLLCSMEEKKVLNEVSWLAYLVEGTPIEINLKKGEVALKHAEAFFELKKKILSKAETFAVQQVFDLKKYLEADIENQMISFGIRAAIEAKKYSRAKVFLDCVEWSNPEKRPFDKMLLLVELFGKSGPDEVFFVYAEKLIKNQGMKNQFLVALENMLQEYPERKEVVIAWMNKQNGITPKKQLSPEMAQLVEALKANIQVLLNEGKTAEAKTLLEELKKYV